MKKILIFLAVMLWTAFAFGEAEMQHVFYNQYNPFETKFVYSNATPDSTTNNIYATGDQLAVNGYILNSLQINGTSVNEYIEVNTYGRIVNQSTNVNGGNGAEWVLLTSNGFGAASSDTSKNVLVDLSSYHVSFIKVGIRRTGSQSTSAVDVVGNFTNDYK